MAKTTSHICIHEGEIEVLKSKIEDFDHVINGNGKPGLRDEMTRLSQSTDRLSCDIKDLRTTISAMQRFMDEITGKRKLATTMQWVATFILLISTFLFGSGFLRQEKIVYLPIDGNTIVRGERVDSIFWSSESNPPMQVEIK